MVLAEHDGHIDLTIEDDGAGFDLNVPLTTGLGLITMRERAAAHSGDLSIASQPDRGTVVKLMWRNDGDQ